MDTFNPNQMPGLQGEPEKKSFGPLIAVIIILVLIVVGGLYFLKERASFNMPIIEIDGIESLEQQGSSDDLDSIEADLNATDLNLLDTSGIEAEIQTEIGI
jgi:hypothetical protein